MAHLMQYDVKQKLQNELYLLIENCCNSYLMQFCVWLRKMFSYAVFFSKCKDILDENASTINIMFSIRTFPLLTWNSENWCGFVNKIVEHKNKMKNKWWKLLEKSEATREMHVLPWPAFKRNFIKCQFSTWPVSLFTFSLFCFFVG